VFKQKLSKFTITWKENKRLKTLLVMEYNYKNFSPIICEFRRILSENLSLQINIRRLANIQREHERRQEEKNRKERARTRRERDYLSLQSL
jgi:hypothetical protein